MTLTTPPLAPIPIFIISFNRGDYLNAVIASYQRQDIAVDIVVHDNGSNDSATLAILSRLEADGATVYRYGPITHPDELNQVDLSVRCYSDEHHYHGPYIVTDCDVDLSIARPDAIRTYIELLDRSEYIECVGPMLRISDIPRSYPLFNRVMLRHIDQFWQRTPEWVDLEAGRVAYLSHAIDTTFAVHRAGSSFRRLKKGLRLYHPFEAKHLDWYVSGDAHAKYRTTSSPQISHWNNEAEIRQYQSAPEPMIGYHIVEGEMGALVVSSRTVLDNPLL